MIYSYYGIKLERKKPMSLKHGMLGMINLKPMTGYELDKEFKDSLKYIWNAVSSQIYAELDKMEQMGWLVSERVMQDEKPNRRVYSITEEGKVELLNWMTTHDADAKKTLTGKNGYLFRVLFGGILSKEQALKLLYSFRDVCLDRKTVQASIRKELGREALEYDEKTMVFFEIVVMHGEMMNQTRLAWIEKAISIVENSQIL
jgi:DNA-binding PadR family transcriptional regulator